VTFFFQTYWNVQFCKVLPSLQELVLLGFVYPQQCFFKILISTSSPMFPIHLGERLYYVICTFITNPTIFTRIQIILSLGTMSTTISHILMLSFSSNCEKRSIWKIEVYRIVLMDFPTRSSHKWETHCLSWFVSHLKQIY